MRDVQVEMTDKPSRSHATSVCRRARRPGGEAGVRRRAGRARRRRRRGRRSDDDNTNNGVFSIEVNPTSGTPTLDVMINNTSILTETFGNNVKRVVHEKFEQSILQVSNTLAFAVTGNGSVNMSDGRVLFKRL